MPVRRYLDDMSSGRINSPASIRTADRVMKAFNGDWGAMEKAAKLGADGVYRVGLPRGPDAGRDGPLPSGAYPRR